MKGLLPLVVHYSIFDGPRRRWIVAMELLFITPLFILLFTIPANLLLSLIDETAGGSFIYYFMLVLLRSAPLIVGINFIAPIYTPYLTDRATRD